MRLSKAIRFGERARLELICSCRGAEGVFKPSSGVASNDSASHPLQSIGVFEAENATQMNTPYQDFGFASTQGKYLKVRLLTNQNGYKNPFEMRRSV